VAYEFTPTGDLAADLAKIYGDASGSAKPMDSADLASAEAAAILISTGSGIPPYEMTLSNIKMDGAASLGTLGSVPRSDHVHPSDTSKVSNNSNETVHGIKTFTSFMVTPSLAPTTDYQVANKKYVDDHSSAFVMPYEDDALNIKMNGAQALGSLDTVARADHVHPSDTSKVSTAGDETIAGVKTFSSFPVTPSAAPTADYETANKKYVDDNNSSQVSAASWQTGMYYKAGQLVFDPAAEEPKLLYRVVTGYTSGATFEIDATDLKILLVGGAGGGLNTVRRYRITATTSMVYNLPYSIEKNLTDIVVNGIYLYPEDFTTEGTVLTFTTDSIQEGDEILVSSVSSPPNAFPIAPEYHSFTGVTSQVNYTLPFTPSEKASIMIFSNGQFIHPDDYELAGKVITFDIGIVGDTDNIVAFHVNICKNIEGVTGRITDHPITATASLSYTLPYKPLSKEALTVICNGVFVHPDDYSLVLDILTFVAGVITEGDLLLVKIIDVLITVNHFEEAPVDSKSYARNNGDWVNVSDSISTKVSLTGNETVAGVKIFSSAPFVPITQNISETITYPSVQVGAGIIESGSNTNGRYVMFSDGTMICWGDWGSYPTLVGTANVEIIILYPKSFVGVSVVSISAIPWASWEMTRSYSITTAVRIYPSASGNGYQWQAIGRWKA